MDIVWWSLCVLAIVFYAIWVAETFTKQKPNRKGVDRKD